MIFRKLLVEWLGTFMLVFIGAGTAAAGHAGLLGAALAHGLVVISVIYLFGNISGAHINPAVSFSLALAGRLPWKDLLPYWTSQFLGAISAAAVLIIIFEGTDSGLGETVLAPGMTLVQGFLIEAILTFLLVTAVFQAAVRQQAGKLAGLVIGLCLIALILLGGPLTGASLNPARTLGPAVFTGSMNLFWLYGTSTLTGAALAAQLDRVLNGKT